VLPAVQLVQKDLINKKQASPYVCLVFLVVTKTNQKNQIASLAVLVATKANLQRWLVLIVLSVQMHQRAIQLFVFYVTRVNFKTT
jgi:hypothetical protein